jgi:hypothetical protein
MMITLKRIHYEIISFLIKVVNKARNFKADPVEDFNDLPVNL